MNEDDLFKTFLQSQLYALDSVQISSREKAERLRHTMFFYHGLLSQGKISCETHQVLTSMLSSEYSSIVDSMRRSQGLTNYKDLFQFSSEEEEVIKNKFSQWESGLSLQDRQPVCSKTESDEVTVRINFSKLNSSEKLDHCSTSNKQNNVVNKQGGGLTTGEQKKVLNNNDISGIAPPVKREAPVFSKRKAYFQPHVSGPENTRPEKARLIDRNQPTKSIVYGNGNSSSKAAGQTNDENTTVECEGDNPFRTAGEQLVIAQLRNKNSSISSQNYGSKKRSLGTRRTGLSGKFVPPISQNENEAVNGRQSYHEEKGAKKNELRGSKYDACEWMKNIDERMIELIENEIMDHGAQVNWEDIAGLEFAKTTIQEIVIWPMLRPDIFTGLRGPPKGLLLFGPPGTGKTLIGKCIASQSNATFFSISASSLTSKWVGEGEKMVRALFGVARCHQPSVIFIDEIDSLLTSRSDNEHESSRRIKTEFLVQLDGATCTANERILVVGATNRPQELDEAARRRLVKRLYIPLPDIDARMQIVVNLLRSQDNETNAEDLNTIAAKTDGFSGADMATLCREAALGPIRTITDIRNIDANDVRPVNISDFEMALRHVRPSVSKSDLQVYVDWNSSYGSSGGEQ